MKNCSCCGHEHHHDGHNHHEHSSKNRQKLQKNKIILTTILFFAAVIVTNVFLFDAPIKILIFAVPYLILGYSVFFNAAKSIVRGKVFNESFLMCIATLAAFAIGEYPEAVFVILFFAIGELCEEFAEGKSEKSIKKLLDIRPDKANLLKDGNMLTVSPEEVEIGDIIVVLAGERIALDGIILEGDALIDTSAITGESMPQEKKVGDSIYSGCVNLNSAIKIKVTQKFAQSYASKIISLAQNAAEKKAKVDRFITKFAKYYTPIVVFAAIFAAVLPIAIFGFDIKYVRTAISFLVVSCPCAIVISVPLTFFGGIGCCSKHGILIKSADSLEKLCYLEKIVFDKTGTLTKGKFEVVEIFAEKMTENELLNLAAMAEKYSNHPISLSIKAAANIDLRKRDVKDFFELSGFGVKAQISGDTVFAGNAALMQKHNISYKEPKAVGTAVHISRGGSYCGYIVIADVLKDESISFSEKIKKMGIKSYMLTGDNEAVAKSIAKCLNIDGYFAELLPEDKVKHIETIIEASSKESLTAFVGDGINDAPVLSRADIGIAMGALGSDAAIEAADVVLMDDNLNRIVTAVNIAKKTKSIVKQNIAFSLFVKFTVMALSVLGLSEIMWFAAFADAGVMLIATLNAMMILKYKA